MGNPEFLFFMEGRKISQSIKQRTHSVKALSNVLVSIKMAKKIQFIANWCFKLC